MRMLWVLVVFLLGSTVIGEVEARREILTARQKERLAKAQRVYLDLIALTDRGEVDAASLTELVSRRMKELEYTVTTDRGEPYDVTFRVKCEQRKVWEGTITSGGDADLPDSPSRVWKGPACQLSYLLSGRKLGWRKEVRTDFQDSVQAAKEAKAEDPGAYSLAKLNEKLERYDFPVLVTADWGQSQRLVTLLDAPTTPVPRKIKIINVLGDMFAADALPQLSTIAKGSDIAVAKAAIFAIGRIGKQESIPLVIDLLQSDEPEIQTAAAKALGQVGAFNQDYSVIEPLIEALKTDNLMVKTEVVWSLGRLPDRRSAKPLRELEKALHKDPNSKVSAEVAELRKAVHWSLRQIEIGDHIF